MTTENTKSGGWVLPILQGVLPIKGGQIPAELIAGITLAALAIPEVMGYTKISGTPVITGLYTILIPMALFAIFGSSRHLVVGADSATAAILAAGSDLDRHRPDGAPRDRDPPLGFGIHVRAARRPARHV
jgi:MFS superfamily sulfate permease-like transporter